MASKSKVIVTGDTLTLEIENENSKNKLDIAKETMSKVKRVQVYLGGFPIGEIKRESDNQHPFEQPEHIKVLETIMGISPNRIIFNPPHTIVLWQDGTKTIVRCGEDDVFNEEVGYAMAFFRKLYGSRKKFKKMLGMKSVRQGESNQADLTPLQKQLTQFNNALNKMRFPSLGV